MPKLISTFDLTNLAISMGNRPLLTGCSCGLRSERSKRFAIRKNSQFMRNKTGNSSELFLCLFKPPFPETLDLPNNIFHDAVSILDLCEKSVNILCCILHDDRETNVSVDSGCYLSLHIIFYKDCSFG